MTSQNKSRLSSLLFYLALFLWVLNFMLGQAALPYPPMLSKLGQLFVTILLILKWLAEKHMTITKLVYVAIIVVTSAIVYFTGGYGAVFTGIFLVISAKDIDFRKILMFSEAEMLIIAAILLLLSQIGTIPDYMYVREYVGDLTLAHSLGFIYYSMPAAIAMTSTITYCYFRKEKCKYIELLALGVLNYLLYRLHTTRLSFFTTVIFLLGYIVVFKLRWVSFKSRFWLFVATITPTLMMVLNFLLSILSINGKFNLVNEYLGTFNVRFRLAGIAYQRYGLHLFGTEIETAGRASIAIGSTKSMSDIYIDSGYMQILLKYGIIFSLMLLIIYTQLFRYMYKIEDKFCYLWLSMLVSISIVNNYLTNPIFNPIMFMIPKYFLDDLPRNKSKSVALAHHNGSMYDT